MITEHEYRLGRSCPTKILHARSGLARADEHDSFALWMRSEAGKVSALARHLFTSAIKPKNTVGTDVFQEILRLIDEGTTVADAALVTATASCRCDFIEPDGAILRAYTIVPKSVDLEKHRFGLEFTSVSGALRRDWREHLELIALRIFILQQLLPERRIIPLIVAPVTRVPCTIEGLHGRFTETDGKWEISGPEVAAEAGRLLRVISVAKECAPLIREVMTWIEIFNAFVAQRPEVAIGYKCKKCEFRVAGKESGYDRCWGKLASVTPHMFDLTHMYFIQDEKSGSPVANRLAREGTVAMTDIPRELIKGEYAARQRMQIEGTTTGREIIQPGLSDVMQQAAYPLHFLDIETLRSLLPAHRGGRVNDLTIFQISVHTRHEAGGVLIHREWLNTEPANPNLRFLAAMRAVIGDTGTVCIWTRYEEVSFRELLSELIASGAEGSDVEWLRGLLGSNRLLDLNAACFAHHFHPGMKGRTSIKAVLPALWSEPSPVKGRAPYASFPCEPYAFLKSDGSVADGCAAMDAYLAMQQPDRRTKVSAELLRYCGVDTIAMAFVWDYWQWRLNPAANTGGEEMTTV